MVRDETMIYRPTGVYLEGIWAELNTTIWDWATVECPLTEYRGSYPMPIHIRNALHTYLNLLCDYLVGLGIPATYSTDWWRSSPIIISIDEKYWRVEHCYLLISSAGTNDVLVKLASRPYVAVPKAPYYKFYDGWDISTLLLTLSKLLQCGTCHYSNDSSEYCGRGLVAHGVCSGYSYDHR